MPLLEKPDTKSCNFLNLGEGNEARRISKIAAIHAALSNGTNSTSIIAKSPSS